MWEGSLHTWYGWNPILRVDAVYHGFMTYDAREQQEERDMAAFDADEDDEDDVDGNDDIGRSDMMDQRERNNRTTTEASLTGRHASVEQDETNGKAMI